MKAHRVMTAGVDHSRHTHSPCRFEYFAGAVDVDVEVLAPPGAARREPAEVNEGLDAFARGAEAKGVEKRSFNEISVFVWFEGRLGCHVEQTKVP
jgi:hypothetical protein